MKQFMNLLLEPTDSIKYALQKLNDTSKQFLIILDKDDKLQGTLTDGDIRRAILNNISLENSIELIMNKNPIYAKKGLGKQEYADILFKKNRKQLPIVNDEMQLTDIFFLDEILYKNSMSNKVILMAGGLGTRLRPLTNEIPKPMLKVGNAPIIETIIMRFKEQGFRDFVLAVNYKKEVIQNYLQDGKAFNVNISYIEEEIRLGTAGALSLINKKLNSPIIVMNGDILTNLDFNELLQNHISSQAFATVCVREYEYQIPYGVVVTENNLLSDIYEKPIQKYLTNAGIYILNPEVITNVPEDTFYDMPDLLNALLAQKKKVNVCTIKDYWIDIGQIEDYKRANLEMLGEKYVCK